MFLQHNGLTIRSATAKDAPQLVAWWNDGAVMAHAGFPLGLGTTVEQELPRLEGSNRMVLEYQGRLIGETNFHDLGEGTAEIGIKICDSTFQERGLGRVYLSMLIDALFARGFGKIVLDTNLNNTRAQHVYEKLGFRKVAVRENSWTDQLGRPQSAVDYQLFPKDFVNFAK